MKGKIKEDGKPVRDVTYVPLTLKEPGKDTDGEILPVGFSVEIGFGYYDDPKGDESAETTNRITEERTRELVIAALGLPANHKTPNDEVVSRGGPAMAFKGREVRVEFTVGKTGMQNVKSFSKVS